MKGRKLLKVISILMIIGGVLTAIVGVIAILGISALVALTDSTEGMGFIYADFIIIIMASVIEFIAGIKGIVACSDPQEGASCIKWGIFIVALTIASTIIGFIDGGKLNITSLVLNLLLPGLYIYSAMQMRDTINI